MSANLDVVRRFVEGVEDADGRHHVLGADEAAHASVASLHPDVEVFSPVMHPDRGIAAPDEVPPDGVFHGRDSLPAGLALMTRHWEIQVSDRSFLEAGDVIVMSGTVTVKGVVTGRTSRSRFVELFHIRDGMIAKIESYLDTLAWSEVLPER